MIYYIEKKSIVFFYKIKNCLEQKLLEQSNYTGYLNDKDDFKDYLARHFYFTNRMKELEDIDTKNIFLITKNYNHTKQSKYICIYHNKTLFIYDYVSFKKTFFVKNIATFILLASNL